MLTELFTSKATYPNNIVIPPVTLRHPTYYNSQASTHRADYSMSRVLDKPRTDQFDL